jgi:hypothetical protein
VAPRERVDEASTLALEATDGSPNGSRSRLHLPPRPRSSGGSKRSSRRSGARPRSARQCRPVISGSIRTPGTDSAFSVGGPGTHDAGPQARTARRGRSVLYLVDPVGDARTAGEQSRTTYSPSPSRLNLDLRSPTRSGRANVPRVHQAAGTFRFQDGLVRHSPVGAAPPVATQACASKQTAGGCDRFGSPGEPRESVSTDTAAMGKFGTEAAASGRATSGDSGTGGRTPGIGVGWMCRSDATGRHLAHVRARG